MHYYLKHFSILHRQSMVYIEKKLKPFGVTTGQFMYILTVCDQQGLSQEKLSSVLKIDKGQVARTIKQLEEQGYLYRTVSEKDNRQHCIFPTAKAVDTYSGIMGVMEELEEFLTEDLSDVEAMVLGSLLDKVCLRFDK